MSGRPKTTALYLGESCIRGHLGIRYLKTRACVDCNRIRTNPDHILLTIDDAPTGTVCESESESFTAMVKKVYDRSQSW